MIWKRKKYLDKIYKALETEKLVLLLGTRQVWKTSLLELLRQELVWEKYFYSFEDDFSRIEFVSKQDFINYFTLSLWVNFYKEGYFFIDEFQYIRNWEQILKSLYDDTTIKIQLIVTGSGLWTYWEDHSWTLVGRWQEIYVYPFDFFEFLEIRWLDTSRINFTGLSDSIHTLIEPYYKEYLSYGWYPAVIKAQSKQEKILELEKIISRYLERDIQFFLQKDEFIHFKKFFHYLQGQIWNLVKKEAIWEYLWIKVRQVEKYLNILEKTLFISRVYPFFQDKSKEYSSLPKFYFWDVGIGNFLEKSFEYRDNAWKVVENFIFNELQKNKTFNSDEIKVYKKITKSEIDFIYDGLDRCIPIEVKSGNKKSIPKIFYSFEETYTHKTSHYIISTQSYSKQDFLDTKEVYFIPNWYVGRFLQEK